MAGYTRDPGTVIDSNPGGDTTKQGITERNSAAIDDLFTNLNTHSNSEAGRTHAEIDTDIDAIEAKTDAIDTAVASCEADAASAAASASDAATSAADAESAVGTVYANGFDEQPGRLSTKIAAENGVVLGSGSIGGDSTNLRLTVGAQVSPEGGLELQTDPILGSPLGIGVKVRDAGSIAVDSDGVSVLLDPSGPLVMSEAGISMPEVPDGGIVVTSSGLKATGIVKATPNDEATADLNAKINPAWPLYDFPDGTVIDDQAQLPLNLKLALLGGLEVVGSSSETATDGLRVAVDDTTIERGASGLGVKGLSYDTPIEGIRFVRGILKIEHDGSGGFTSAWGAAMRASFPLGLDDVFLGASVTVTTVPTMTFVGGNGVCYDNGTGYFYLDTETLFPYAEKIALIPGNIELNTTGTTLTNWNVWNSTDTIDGLSSNRPVVRIYNGATRIVPSAIGAGLLWLPFWAVLPKHPLA